MFWNLHFIKTMSMSLDNSHELGKIKDIPEDIEKQETEVKSVLKDNEFFL